MTIWLTAARSRSGKSMLQVERPVRRRRRPLALTQQVSSELLAAAFDRIAPPLGLTEAYRNKIRRYWHWREIKARRQRRQAQRET